MYAFECMHLQCDTNEEVEEKAKGIEEVYNKRLQFLLTNQQNFDALHQDITLPLVV